MPDDYDPGSPPIAFNPKLDSHQQDVAFWKSVLRFGTVTDTDGAEVEVQLDGPSGAPRLYPANADVTFAPGDRVALLGHTPEKLIVWMRFASN